MDFSTTASKLSRGPLGIIALLIVLVYALASIVAGAATFSSSMERIPLVYFMVLFPVLVLGCFTWLLARHPTSLYPPTDFKDERNYLEAQRIARATGALVAANLASTSGKSPDQAVAEAVAAIDQAPRRGEEGRCILWVDDRPENNRLLRDAMREFGIDVHIALSTQQALDALRRQEFSAIISDMGRVEGPQEGYVLLEAVRSQGLRLPFFIYAGSNLDEHRKEALRRGAQLSTNDANELFRQVIRTVSGDVS